MIEYNLSVSLADGADITDDILSLVLNAINEANSRRNALRKGRKFIFKEIIDKSHFHLVLQSNSEVIPSRALSALTRSILDIDTSNIIKNHITRKAVFICRELAPHEEKKVTSLSDIAMIQELTNMLFGQSTMSLKSKRITQETNERIRQIIIEYLNQKSNM